MAQHPTPLALAAALSYNFFLILSSFHKPYDFPKIFKSQKFQMM